MPVSDSYRTFVLEQLSRTTDRVRMMRLFGGVGVYAGDHFFALIAGDELYLKVDDSNRPDFEARGMQPFRPFGEGGEAMQYYKLPEEVLEDPDELRPWVERAVQVAASKKKRRTPEARKRESRKPAARRTAAKTATKAKPKK